MHTHTASWHTRERVVKALLKICGLWRLQYDGDRARGWSAVADVLYSMVYSGSVEAEKCLERKMRKTGVLE